MNINIVSDSSSNIFSLEGIGYKSVPLKIISDKKEYEDVPGLNVSEMIRDMNESKEKFTTSCPNAYEWEKAFEGGDNIIALTITSKLSGSFSAATAAAQRFKQENPDKNIYVFDSLSVGPEMQLIIEKIKEIA
ncbi:MAG: DegV family protein, partial [Acutalibacteraceae bacterium]